MATRLEEQEAEPLSESEIEAVPLEILQVNDHDYRKGVRILVRPLIEHLELFSNGLLISGDSFKQLELRADGASLNSPKHTVLAITQDLIDAKCTIRTRVFLQGEIARPPLWCEFYYLDPARDSIAFLNKSDVPVSLSRMSHASSSLSLNESYILKPRVHKSLRPGTFRLEYEDVAVLDIRILGKRPTGKGPVIKAESRAVSDATAAPKGKSSSSVKDPKKTAGAEDDSRILERPLRGKHAVAEAAAKAVSDAIARDVARRSSSVKYLEETADVEEDFSPRLKRVGHVEFDKIAKANEARKRQPMQPPPIPRTTPSVAAGLEPAYGARSGYQTREEDAKEEDMGVRQQRLLQRMNERPRPATVVTQSSYQKLDEDAEKEDMEVRQKHLLRRMNEQAGEDDEWEPAFQPYNALPAPHHNTETTQENGEDAPSMGSSFSDLDGMIPHVNQTLFPC